MSARFHSMRVKFGTTFNKIRDAINDTSLTVNRLKCFLQDCYPELTPKLTCPSSDTIDGILDVVKESVLISQKLIFISKHIKMQSMSFVEQ